MVPTALGVCVPLCASPRKAVRCASSHCLSASGKHLFGIVGGGDGVLSHCISITVQLLFPVHGISMDFYQRANTQSRWAVAWAWVPSLLPTRHHSCGLAHQRFPSSLLSCVSSP